MIKLSLSQQGIFDGLLRAKYTIRIYKSPNGIRPLVMPENSVYGQANISPEMRLAFRIIPKDVIKQSLSAFPVQDNIIKPKQEESKSNDQFFDPLFNNWY